LADRFQVLSLDGGGARGLFAAAVLAAVERDLNIKLVDHFDLIAGTSTGGIIAIGLGLGLTPREMVEFYVKHSPQVFRNRLYTRSFQQWIYRKYSAHPLESALKEMFGERPFGESTKRLVIPSYDLGTDDVYVFRTAHDERFKRDYKSPAWHVAMATSAAPTYFPSFRRIDRLRLIDGGIWANNPAMVGLVESFGTLKSDLSHIHILSIGTYESISHRRRLLNNGGRLVWARTVPDVILKAGSVGINNQVRFLIGDRFVRLNPKVAANEVSLDEADSADDLIGRASYYSRRNMPEISSRFMQHRAATFIPVYKP